MAHGSGRPMKPHRRPLAFGAGLPLAGSGNGLRRARLRTNGDESGTRYQGIRFQVFVEGRMALRVHQFPVLTGRRRPRRVPKHESVPG